MDEHTVYEFDWDPRKALSNLRDHGIAFDQAATVFLDAPALTVCDTTSQHEERWFTLGCDTSGKLCWRLHTRMRRRSPVGFECVSSRPARRRGMNGEAMKRNRNRKAAAAAKSRRSNGDDMPAEIDFSRGTRGKFYRPNARLKLPLYLDADVQAYLSAIAAKKGVPLSDLANEMLKKEIEILEALK